MTEDELAEIEVRKAAGHIYGEDVDCLVAAVRSITKERDMWRNKSKSCAWCRGNMEVGDHTRDCPVYILRGVEDERDELRAECETLRAFVKAAGGGFALNALPERPATGAALQLWLDAGKEAEDG